jgi:hypothetical protein
MAEIVIRIAVRIHVRPVLVLVQEVLDAGDGRGQDGGGGGQLLQGQHGAAAAVLEHAQHGEVVAGLVAFAAALVLVVDDVLPDVAVDVLVVEVSASSSEKKNYLTTGTVYPLHFTRWIRSRIKIDELLSLADRTLQAIGYRQGLVPEPHYFSFAASEPT